MNTNQKQSQELSELRTQVSALNGRLDSQDHTLAELRDLVATLSLERERQPWQHWRQA